MTDAALEAGYAGVSAFTHAFRCKLGQTPSAYRLAASVPDRAIRARPSDAGQARPRPEATIIPR